jgi:V/A-type H+/Na+-transporting ATPase subunit I
MIRPRPTRWFELLVARDDTTLALEALAGTGAVELETRSDNTLPEAFADLRPLLTQFNELALRYRAYWPAQPGAGSAVPEPPLQALQRGITRLRQWAQQVEPVIQRLQRAHAEEVHLRHWQSVIGQLDAGAPDLGLAARAGPSLVVRLLCGPADGAMPLSHGNERADGPLLRPVALAGAQGLLAIGTAAQLAPLVQQVHAQKGEVLTPPAWLSGEGQVSQQAAAARLATLQQVQAQASHDIARLGEAHGLRTVLADARRLQWVLDNVHGLEAGELFCWITGWTSALGPEALECAIERSGARALLRMAAPPAGKSAPLQLHNPGWARPFEVFSRAMGMPASSEADPSVLLALAVPLMFGYMFGDLGQGLVIAVVGFALRDRFAMARLFIAGGLSAAVFGGVFGSVFSWHGLPAWWVQPLADPLAVLVVPLVGGALLLAAGLLLAALGAFWRGELALWLRTDLGLLLAYVGLLAGIAGSAGPSSGPLAAAGYGLAAGGALLFCAGHGWQAGRGSASLAAIGELVERLLQLLINTLSFARVGAFALAHAGLSSAIVALAQAAEHPLAMAAVMVAGNLVVIVLEGLVVSIQTTRLVLFEFFARFLQGTGRVFRPLPLPPSAHPPLQET